MSSTKPHELKKRLIAAGLEVFRVEGGRIHLADRVRDNLILDSGVCTVCADPLVVRLVVRVQRSAFPSESDERLFDRARRLAAPCEENGYAEADTAIVPIRDPGGAAVTLDTWYEVAYEKAVGPDELLDELQYALGLEKTVSAG